MTAINNIGIRGLMAFQAAMNNASQNIANVNTPYYSRKQVNFSEGNFLTGVSVDSIQRIYDQAASFQVQNSNCTFSKNDTFLQKIKNFEPLLDNDSNSISKNINDAITALQQLNVDSSSLQGRSVYLSKLTIMINQFSTVRGQINTQLQGVNQALQTYATDASQLVANIANINLQLSNQQVGEDQSTILDQREQLVQELANYFNFTTQVDNEGSVNILLNNGIQLVDGNTALSLTTIPDAANPADSDLAVNINGKLIAIDSFIQNGQVGGLLNFRDVLEQTERNLDRLSLAFTDTFNTQNNLGIDYNGSLGVNIFNDINLSNMTTGRVISNMNNVSNASLAVTVNNVQQLTTSDYKFLASGSNSYVLTRTVDNTVVSSGAIGSLPQAISVDGFTLNIASGSFTAGDQYVITPTAGAIDNMELIISDPKLLALAQPVVANASQQNVGSGISTLTSITDTTNSAFSLPKQLNPPITVQFLTDTTYQLVNATNSSVIEGPITYDPAVGSDIFPTPGSYDPGYRINISGAVNAGDTFNINYNSNSKSDNRNGLIMANLYQAGILDNGSSSFLQDYHISSNNVSIQVNSAEISYDTSQALQEQALENFNEISAVNLQEETTDLASYQQAYQASAEVLQVGKDIFEIIISMIRN